MNDVSRMFSSARLFIITLCLMVAGAFTPALSLASDQEVLAAIGERMQPVAVLRGHFAQEKYFSIMTRPLKSTGTFTLDRARGIWWHNITPIPGDLVLSDKGIVQRSTQGHIQTLDSAQQPALKLMTSIIRQLVGGEWVQLQKHFDITASVTAEHWSATLTPKAGSLFASHATQIDVSGDRFVESISLLEKNTDKTRIVFSQLSSDTQLQPGEADAFAW